MRKVGDAVKYKARIEHISHDIDLAVLTVSEPDFFKKIPSIRIAKEEPFLQDEVFVAGFPEGGDTLSVTRGIVSRIEPGYYTQYLEMLTIQIDAAINDGNSGGPVFLNGEVIGVAFQGLDNADGIGYIIPSKIVRHFLEGIKRFGKFPGICSLGLELQFMENEALRRAKKMKDDGGVLIMHVDPMSCLQDVGVKEGDVLLKIDNVRIANDGTIKWRKRERVNFENLIQCKFPGDNATLTLLSDGVQKDVTVTLTHIPPLIIDTLDAKATYVFFAGLIFVPLSMPFLDSYGGGEWEDAQENLTVLVTQSRREKKEEELIVMCRVIVNEINYGYEDFEGEVVKSVNGVNVNNMKHLYELLNDPNNPEIIEIMVGHYLICIEKSLVPKASKQIMKQHKIPKVTNIFDVPDEDDDTID